VWGCAGHAGGTGAIRASICAAVGHLRHGPQILEELIQREGLLIVGAEDALETGVVDFCEGMPPSN